MDVKSKELFLCTYKTLLGELTIGSTQGAVCIVSQGSVQGYLERCGKKLEKRYSIQETATAVTGQASEELQEYFQGKRKQFSVPLYMEGTDFQKAVWNALLRIPYGETRSYKEVARMVGNPKACRAVGMANNRNPLMILVPCHRVVGADGSLVGYAGGLDFKQRLLSLEMDRNTESGFN